MQINSKYNKIKTIPFKISISKFLSKVVYPISSLVKRRKMDDLIKKYQNYEFPKINLTNLSQISIEILKNLKINDINPNSLENYIKHNFKIFSLETSNFNQKTSNINDSKSQNNLELLIKNIVPDEFQTQSKAIVALIVQNYQFIDWHSDLKNQYTWNPKAKYVQIKYENEKNADIKFPWELSRLNYLPILATSYDCENVETEKFKTEVINEILDFIAFNPPTCGVNWKSPMEIAIRSFNIVLSLNILYKSNHTFNEEFLKIVSNYLYFSGLFIWENIEWSNGLRNNHYFANLMGLIAISNIFPDDKIMKEIHTKSIQKFTKEILVQFNEDGSNFEGSVPYHFFMLEILYYTFELTGFLTIINDKKLIERIHSIINFSKNIIGQKGFIPQIGDNDSGKIIEYNDLIIFKDKYQYLFSLINTINNYILNNYNNNLINFNNKNKTKYQIFKDIGVFIYEDSNYKIWISTGRIAQFGKGGHNHFDLSSFVCEIKGKPTFVDPGTYCYTSNISLRNKFRSSQYHNRFSPQQELESQNSSLEDLFWLFEKPAEYVIEEGNNLVKLIINYNERNFRIERTYILEEKQFQIIDKIPIILAGEINFHLDPKITLHLNSDNKEIIINNSAKLIYSVKAPLIEKYYFSPEYGIKEEALVIKFNNLSEINSYLVKIMD